MTGPAHAQADGAGPSFREALRVWIKVALLSFGGPAEQIAVMHRLVVEEKGWVDERRFLLALSFVPCFLWIFLGAPYIERLQSNRALNAALTAVTAAVVGVILNLAVWFCLNALFGHLTEVRTWGLRLLVPAWSTLDLPALAIAATAFLALFRWKAGLVPTLGGSALAGLLYRLALAP